MRERAHTHKHACSYGNCSHITVTVKVKVLLNDISEHSLCLSKDNTRTDKNNNTEYKGLYAALL